MPGQNTDTPVIDSTSFVSAKDFQKISEDIDNQTGYFETKDISFLPSDQLYIIKKSDS